MRSEANLNHIALQTLIYIDVPGMTPNIDANPMMSKKGTGSYTVGRKDE